MPETTTPTTAPVRPPFTGNESLEAICKYAAKELNDLAGRTADGRPRFESTLAPAGVRYVESGLTFRLRVRRARRGRASYGEPVDGVTPFEFSATAEALNPNGATGARIPAMTVKLHANGEARWNKIHVAAVLHAQRAVEARERLRLANERKTLAWEALAAYVSSAESAHRFPPPSRRGVVRSGSVDQEWRWNLTIREGVEGERDLGLFAAVRITAPVEIPDDWEPATTPVDLTLGFARYESGERTVTLRDAFALVSAFARMRDGVAQVVPGGLINLPGAEAAA